MNGIIPSVKEAIKLVDKDTPLLEEVKDYVYILNGRLIVLDKVDVACENTRIEDATELKEVGREVRRFVLVY